MLLYQHSPRCPMALPLFLDYNPDYWCFVPMKLSEANMAHSTARFASPRRTNESLSMPLSSALRPEQEVRSLVEKVPKPPVGYIFSVYQRQQQAYFFKWLKDRIVPQDNVDLYNADIVAICK